MCFRPYYLFFKTVYFAKYFNNLKQLLDMLGTPNYISNNLHLLTLFIMTIKKGKLSSSLEDYLEAIYNLAGDNNITRSKDIAQNLGVSRASVSG